MALTSAGRPLVEQVAILDGSQPGLRYHSHRGLCFLPQAVLTGSRVQEVTSGCRSRWQSFQEAVGPHWALSPPPLTRGKKPTIPSPL